MADFELKEGQIFLFHSNATKDKAPALNGKIMIGGKIYPLVLWAKEYGFSGQIDTKPKKQEPSKPSYPERHSDFPEYDEPYQR